MNWLKRAFSLLVVLMAVMIAVSCTTERDAVDKTDDLALDKRLFEGEFFLRQTIVDLPYTADYAFIGESNDGKVVRWKITKDWLIAYSVWDKINTLDTDEVVNVNETPIVAYRIAMHYDIVPTENPTTGEALPVLVPNQDRNWNERRYFSLAGHPQSGVSNYELKYLHMTQEWGAPFYRAGLATASNWEFYSHDGTFVHPKKYRDYTAIQDEDSRKAKEIEWFQFWATEYFEPINNWSNIYTWEDIDMFIGSEPAKVTYRYVFTKVNRDVFGRREYDLKTKEFAWKKGIHDNGFRPLQFKDELFRQFGYFTNTFRGYDNYHGLRDDNTHILANYWNIAWADGNKTWNYTCDDRDYSSVNECMNDIKYQQKLVFVSSPKTPLRMIPINCAIAKDYNYSMLAARYASMNPGSDPREFTKWYMENYENDFFTEENGVKIRDIYWYLEDELPSDWESKCFVSDKHAWIQNWDGSFIDEGADQEENDEIRRIMDQHKHDLVVLVKNPVEGYIESRDGQALYGYGNYHNYDSSNRANAAKICVTEEESKESDPGKLSYYESCITSEGKGVELYVDDAGRPEWRGDRWDCKVYDESEKCPEGYVEAKAACVLNDERRCETADGVPVLRHKYQNGNPKAAMLNWVEKPTDYGILGVAQWNVNPETGQSMGGAANVAGSVLAWVTTRAVELARMTISKDDPAAWDFADLLDPEYYEYPSTTWDNNPDSIETKSMIGQQKKLENRMIMINQRPGAFSAGLEGNQDGALSQFIDEFEKNSKIYDRFDWSNIKDSDWESQMVPYSVKKALFPWANPADNPSYSDAEKEIMEPWYGGPAMMNAQLVRFIEARARDFDFDESFLDGTIINFIKEKQKEFRGSISGWDGPNADKYEESLIYAIYHELEKLLYKGVAQHEMGHVVGLRHNFAASADKNNYGDGFFRTENYPALNDKIEEYVAERLKDPENTHGTIGDEVWRLKTQHESTMSYFAYGSVMDYQREAYTHASGLGKYDDAALKFVYGRSIEQHKIAGDETYGVVVREGDENDAAASLGNYKMNPVRDPEYPDFVKVNTPFVDKKTGELIKVEKPREVVEYYDDKGDKITRVVPRYHRTMLGRFDDDNPRFDHDCDGTDPDQYYCDPDTTYLVNDGSQYKYIFVSDEKSREEPMGNVFDAGYTGADIIRQMTDMDHMYYYLRYFRRGNPKFREFRGRTSWHMILNSLLRQYVFVHFLTDYNFHVYGKWFRHTPLYGADGEMLMTGCIPPNFDYIDDPAIRDSLEQQLGPMAYRIPFDENLDNFVKVTNHQCEEHYMALKGKEFWLDDNGKVRTVTPLGVADHIIAGMKGVQYLLFDSMYRPSTGKYMRQDIKAPTHFDKYGYEYCEADSDCRENPKSGPNVYECDTVVNKCVTTQSHINKENEASLEERTDRLDPLQTSVYSSMDNYIPGIDEEADLFGIDPKGFVDVPANIGRYHRDRYDIQDNPSVYYDKVIRRGYGIEKMVTLYTLSNSGWLDGKYRRESRANSLYQLFDGLENVIYNVLSDISTEESVMSFSPYCVDTLLENKLVRVNYPVNLLTNFAAAPSFWTGSREEGVYEPVQNLCAKADPSDPGRFAPVHAGWIYFDKMWPNYWAMGNMANISADTSVLRRWTSNFIPTHERYLYAKPDVNEVEFLNKDENGYYRARIPVSAMDNADSYAYRHWRECRDEILKVDINGDYSACITRAVWPVWYLEEFIRENHPEITNIAAEVIRMQTDGEDIRFADGEQFTHYLSKKYARYSPAFRVATHAKQLKEKELLEASSGSREPYSRLVIMETTLDQLNSFAADHFGTAAFYVQYY
jgi:hypothetical protein